MNQTGRHSKDYRYISLSYVNSSHIFEGLTFSRLQGGLDFDSNRRREGKPIFPTIHIDHWLPCSSANRSAGWRTQFPSTRPPAHACPFAGASSRCALPPPPGSRIRAPRPNRGSSSRPPPSPARRRKGTTAWITFLQQQDMNGNAPIAERGTSCRIGRKKSPAHTAGRNSRS